MKRIAERGEKVATNCQLSFLSHYTCLASAACELKLWLLLLAMLVRTIWFNRLYIANICEMRDNTLD